jgi:hypothetical protein
MARTTLILVASAFCLAASPLFAQAPPPPPTATIREMAKLSFLTGTWKGEGMVDLAPGQRFGFTSSEEVGYRLDGLILTIEGMHFASIPGVAQGPKMHHAFATIHYDSFRRDYAIRAAKSDGTVMDARGQVDNNAFVWGFLDPRMGHLRFTLRLSADGKWVEIGERSPDGQVWTKYFEMTLSKQ